MQRTITSNQPHPPNVYVNWNSHSLSLSHYYNFITIHGGTNEAWLNVQKVNSFLIFRKVLWRHPIDFHLCSRLYFQWQDESKWKSVIMKVKVETSSMLDNNKVQKAYFVLYPTRNKLHSLQLQIQCCWANHSSVHHFTVRGYTHCVLRNIHQLTFQRNFVENKHLQTKRRLLHLKAQFVQRCKHFSFRL
jgi:hypothetical protein